ncbi:MAG: NFACT RNA binding domain-containing protein [Treponema sp.]|nr:NFACT RNA binding domain-containing protein [Treponema sp.]
MSLNCNELNLVLSELDVDGSFIQEIVQPGFDTLVFRAIKGGDLKSILICTGAQGCRINETKYKPPKNPKPLRFNEFLKSRVQGMRINSIVQMGLDRIVKMDVSTWKEKLYIYIRLWSGAANVIVCDEENNILDCMYRRPKKNEVTGGKFQVEEKIPTEEEKNLSLQKFPARLFNEELIQLGQNQEQIDGMSYNQKVDLFYSEHASNLSRESLLEQAERWYNVKHSKMENALSNLLKKKESFENADSMKHTGDLILAYASQAQGNELSCIDYETGKEVHIRLDSRLSPQDNAKLYYESYKKAVSGKEALEHDIEISRKEIAVLEEKYNAILKEQNVLKIEQLIRKTTQSKQQAEKKTHAGLHYEIDGWTILVGRTATENDDLLRHTVKGQDMWMHTRDYAGGYVFIKAKAKKTIPLEILLYAGNLAVYHSKARKNGQADLYYTQVKHLRRAKNGPKGLVLPTNEKNILIKIEDARLRKLEEYEKGLTRD